MDNKFRKYVVKNLAAYKHKKSGFKVVKKLNKGSFTLESKNTYFLSDRQYKIFLNLISDTNIRFKYSRSKDQHIVKIREYNRLNSFKDLKRVILCLN